MTVRTLVPDAGTQVRVVTDAGAVYAAVVRAARGPHVLDLEIPQVPQLRTVPVQRGAAGTVQWGRPDAEYRARVRLLSEAAGVLQVELSDGWKRVQRREHVRARYAADVGLVDLSGKRWHGVTLDVSESGLRCRVEYRAGLKAGDRLMASVHLAAQQFDVAGEVQWVAAGDQWHSEVGIRFLDPGRQADAIRAWVFAFQIRSRELM